MKENKYYTNVNFFLPFSYLMILGLFFTEKTKQVASASKFLLLILLLSRLFLWTTLLPQLFSALRTNLSFGQSRECFHRCPFQSVNCKIVVKVQCLQAAVVKLFIMQEGSRTHAYNMQIQ